MSVEISGLPGNQIQGAGDNSRVSSPHQSGQASTAQAGAASPGDDRVSLTSSATQLQRLTDRVSQMPMVDMQLVDGVRRSLDTGSYQFEPTVAADNLLTQEHELAVLSSQGIQK